jgi:DNA invertase Pin-like site-specific DNA recombinase
LSRRCSLIYLRVSKGERHTDNQRPDIERVVSMRGLELVAEHEEKASAARVRPVFDRMVRDAHKA